MMTILACTVAIVLTVKMNNKNVGKGVAVGAEYTAIKSDGNVTEEQLSISEETVNNLLFANKNAILQYLMPLFYYIAISIAN